MEKIYSDLIDIAAVDDMRVLNYLVVHIKGLRPVSGTPSELALTTTDEDF